MDFVSFLHKVAFIAKEAVTPVTELFSNIKNNPRFSKKLDLSDEALQDGDDNYRYDCLMFVYRRRDRAFKYSLFFTAAALIYMIVFGIIGINSAFGRIPNPLGELSAMHIVLPVVIVPAAFAGLMKSPAIIFSAVLYMLFGAYFLIAMQFLVVIPFCIIGAVLYFRLLGVVGTYDTLSKLPGFPSFITQSTEARSQKPED